jgi:hypothetical protein
VLVHATGESKSSASGCVLTIDRWPALEARQLPDHEHGPQRRQSARNWRATPVVAGPPVV